MSNFSGPIDWHGLPATKLVPSSSMNRKAGTIAALFDLQVNGFAGIDFQKLDVSAAHLHRACRALRRHRTCHILLTLITDEISSLEEKFARFEAMRTEDPLIRDTVVGYHLEGPFLSPRPGFHGAHRPDLMRPPDWRTFAQLQRAANGRIRLVTIAPEWKGSPRFIARAASEGVLVAIGHSDANVEQIDAAARAGLSLCTHLGNGCPAELHRHDNIVQRLLARDDLVACVIPDGIHLPTHVLRTILRVKPRNKIVLTTDCMAAAGAPPGRYSLQDEVFEVSRDRVVRKPGSSNFAGSALTLDRGVNNTTSWTDLSFREAWACASTRVAQLFGVTPERIAAAELCRDGVPADQS